MIKLYFKPFLKRFIGLFISMTFVSLIAISLLIGFSSSISGLSKDYNSYMEDYGAPSALVTTEFTLKNKTQGLEEVEGIENYDTRLSIDSYLRKSDGRVITSRIFSFNEETNKVFRRYVVEKTEYDKENINVCVTSKFAANNDFHVGDKIEFGYYNLYVGATISEIVDAAEAIYVRASNYILSDNTDFGYVYVSEQELNNALYRLSVMAEKAILEDPEFAEYYNKAREVIGVDIPDLANPDIIGVNYASLFFNQVLVKANSETSEETILGNVTKFLEEKNVTIKSSSTGHNSIYEAYMRNALRQLTIASIFLPVFFYAVTMIVVILFLNQIIKTMTPDIGTMMGVGVSPKEISAVFSVFTLLMSGISSFLGIGIGYGICLFLSSVFRVTYSIPTIVASLNPLWTAMAILSIILVGQLASFISCRAIFRITPKDAMLSNETKRKNLPKWLERFIDKAPMNIKLSVNTIAQNPRRFLISTFSMFASFVMIVLVSFFSVSKNEMINQTLETRLQYDCQIYASQKVDDSFFNELKGKEFVKKIESCYFTYVEVKHGENKLMLETLALEPTDSSLVYIPSEKGDSRIEVDEEGIILTNNDAKRLGVGAGDIITINDKEIKVSALSAQYFHMTQYMAKDTMDKLGVQYVSSFIANVSDEKAFLNYLATNENKCLTVFTSSLKNDMNKIFSSVDIFIYILIGSAFVMGFIILAIMSQNALLEQKRQISIMRAIGFRVMDVSNLWTLQSVAELLFSTVFAIPNGVLFAVILFNMASSSSQIYPFIFSWPMVFISFGFTLFVILFAHLFSMLSIKRWNLAENTRSRE